MQTGDRVVVFVFVAAVAAAVGAVGYLMISGPKSPPPAPPSPQATGTTPAPPVKKTTPMPPPHVRTRREPGKNAPVYEIAGEVRKPDGTAAVGAKVSVLPPGTVASAPAKKPGAGAGDPAVVAALRDVFALDPDELDVLSPYTGIPLVAAEATKPRPLREGTADGEGKFRVRVPSAGPFRLEARLEDVGSAAVDEVAAGAPGLVLRLGPAATLRGKVLSADSRNPVPGAAVVVQAGGLLRSASADTAGEFSVPDLAPGRYSLQAGAPGSAPAALAGVEVAAGAPPVEVLLGEGFVIRVRVMRDDRGPGMRRSQGAPPPSNPIDGALVVLYDRRQHQYVTGTTDSDGNARISRLGPGRWRIGVRKEGYLAGIAPEVLLKAGGIPEEAREVRLLPEVVTPVKVLDASGGPIQGARVFTGGVDDEFDPKWSEEVARTDSDGVVKFAFDLGISRRSVLYVLTDDGTVTKVEPDDVRSGTEVKVGVKPGRLIQGRVTDDGGRPVPGAKIEVTVNDAQDVETRVVVYTDSDGRYRCPRLPHGDVTFDLEKDDAWDQEDVEATVTDDPLVKDFKIDLEPMSEPAPPKPPPPPK